MIPSELLEKTGKEIPETVPFKSKDEVMLAMDWDFETVNPRRWFWSEKMDGIRGYWDGSNMFSKEGNYINTPASIRSQLPDFPLDGELWMGRNSFYECKRKMLTGDWSGVSYNIFDAPKFPGSFSERLQHLRSTIKQSEAVKVVDMKQCSGIDQLWSLLREIVREGGEGIVLRKDGSPYIGGRSENLLRVKPLFMDVVQIIENEEMVEENGAFVFKPALVRNSWGAEFRLFQRISEKRFRHFHDSNRSLVIAFNSVTTQGNPRNPVVLEVLEEKIGPYVLSKNNSKEECTHCKKKFQENELGVKVIGLKRER